LPFDLGPLAWGWLALVVLGAAFVRGYSGFGSAALMVAGGSLAADPSVLVPVVVLIELALAVPLWTSVKGDIDWRRVGALFVGCLVGVPLGVRAIAAMGPDATRASIAVIILLGCAALMRGWRLDRPAGLPAHGVVGILSGIANGAAVGGLPVAAFFAAQPIVPAAFRATLVAYFALLDIWTIPVMAREGLFGWDSILLAALGLPLSVLGLHLGSRRFLAAPPEEFRRFAIRTLVALALLGLLRAAL
jgi:uncharacterized protein